MKKIIIAMLVFLMILSSSVKAGNNDTTVKIDYLENVYGNFLIGNLFYWNQIGLTHANDKLAYCIEPGKWIDETTYDSFTDFKVKNLTDTDKHRLELYAYYGYQYKGHKTVKYYLATQELIWRYLGIKEMYWSTKGEHNGERINVENEKNIINDLIKKHNDLPSFNNETFEINSGKPEKIIDKNNVLEDFDFVFPIDHYISKEGNEIMIIPKKVGRDTIKLLKYSNDYKTSFIYTKNDSQAITTLGLTNKIYSQFNLKSRGFKLNIQKKDRQSNSNVPIKEGSLQGAIYELTNKFDYSKTIQTDENGQGTLEDIPADNYVLKEIKASKGYTIDENEYPVSFGKDSEYELDVDVFEDAITNEVELIKVYSDGQTGLVNPENNILFRIYDKDNNLVKEISTDITGRAKTTLNYGTYTIKQVNSTPNYEKVEDFTIFVDENNNKPYEYILSDTLISSRIKIVKVDELSSPIQQEGIKFKIKNLDTDRYVKQKITYPEEKIIDTFVTNKDGIVTTPYPIGAGNYQIEEVKAPFGYLINNEAAKFTINEDTDFQQDGLEKFYEVKVINKKPKGKIVIDKKGSKKTWSLDENKKIEQNEILESLSGVEFNIISNEDIYENSKLIYKNKEIVKKLTTIDGQATTLLPLGNYCVLETKTIDGYILDNNKQCFELKYKDEHTQIVELKLEYINKYIDTNIILTKLGEDMIDIKNNVGIYKDKYLENIEFGLYTDEDLTVGDDILTKDTELLKAKTDENGKIYIENIPKGQYYIKEIKANDNYIISDKKHYITVDGNNINQQLEIKNVKKKGKILISKYDLATKKALKNALFKIENSDKKEWSFISDDKGIILLENIEYGTYFLEELKAPTGYQKIKNIKNIKVDQELVKLEIGNSKYQIPNTSTDTKIKLYFLSCIGIIGLLGLIIQFVTRKKYD